MKFENLHPTPTGTPMTETAQLLADGLSVNMSSIYTRLIKDAARCNSYSSDLIISLEFLDEKLRNFNPREPWTPEIFGFRKMGVDHRAFVESRCEKPGDLLREYFALYSLDIHPTDYEGFYDVILTEYAV